MRKLTDEEVLDLKSTLRKLYEDLHEVENCIHNGDLEDSLNATDTCKRKLRRLEQELKDKAEEISQERLTDA